MGLPLNRKHIAKYSLLIIGLIVLAVLLFGPESEICEKAKDAAAKNCSPYNIVLVALWHIGDFLDRWSAAIVAVATLVVAFFTYTLWRSTNRLSDAADQQKIDTANSIRIARRSALAATASSRAARASVLHAENSAERQLRAYVWSRASASEFSAGAYFGEDGDDDFAGWRIAAQSRIFNSGRTPAYEVHRWSNLGVFAKELPPNFSFEEPPEEIVAPRFVVNPRSMHTMSTDLVISTEEWNAVEEDSRRIYLWGVIRYKDAFNVDRCSAFRLYLQYIQGKKGGGIWAYCDQGNEAD